MSSPLPLKLVSSLSLISLCLLSACGESKVDATRSAQAMTTDTANCTPAKAPERTGMIVTAWQAAPSDALVTHPISGLSVRQSFAPHWSGQTMRLRVTNQYSSMPIVLDRVHIARELTPGSPEVIPGTECLLRFGGQSKVRLAPGESRLSDWVIYPIEAFRRVSISFHAPELTPQITRHLNANELVYISLPGDHTTDSKGAAYQAAPDGYASNFLAIDTLEVVSTKPARTLVVAGDSITDGSDSTTGFLDGKPSGLTSSDQRYPDHLQRRILAAGLDIAVANAGIGGNELLRDGWLPQFGPALLRRLDADVLEKAGASHVLLMIGTNDFGNPKPGESAPGADAVIAGLKEVISRVHAAGLKIILGTIPPAEGTVWDGLPGVGSTPLHIQVMHGTAAARRGRDDTNAWIRQQSLSDGVVDFDACLRDPERPGYLAPGFNSGDNLHPNPSGYAAMAQCINLEHFTGAAR